MLFRSAGLTGAIVGAAIMLFALPAELFGRVPVPSGTLAANAQRVAVIDGETLLLDQTLVRLQGVTAPARGQRCQGSNDCGAASAEKLASLVRGQAVACRLNGRDRDGFARGLCEAAGTDLNRALVAAGWAHARDEGPGFSAEEADARAAHRGMWP